MAYEVDFLPVGDSNGDAICIRYGDDAIGYRIHVVDGGYTETGNNIISHIKKYYGNPSYIDAVILSHADDDHATGLLPVVEHFDVGGLWMNRPWLYANEIINAFNGNFTVSGLARSIRESYPRLAALEDLATKKSIPIHEAFAGDSIGQFRVLAPSRERYLSLIPEFSRTPKSYAEAKKSVFEAIASVAKELKNYFENWTIETLSDSPPACTPSNESSLVQLGVVDGKKILLTADVGPEGLSEAADWARTFGLLSSPDVVQIPHHGSRRNVTPSILNRWLGNVVAEGVFRGTALCSVGDNKSEYPRRRVANAFMRRGYKVIVTRGSSKSSFFGMPNKPGWTDATPEEFSYSFEE